MKLSDFYNRVKVKFVDNPERPNLPKPSHPIWDDYDKYVKLTKDLRQPCRNLSDNSWIAHFFYLKKLKTRR